MLDQATIDALEAPVNAGVAEAQAAAASTWGQQGKIEVANAKKLYDAIQSWEGEQLDQVYAGTRTEQNWIDYGKNLADQVARYVRDNKDFYAKWSAALITVGRASSPFSSTSLIT